MDRLLVLPKQKIKLKIINKNYLIIADIGF
jgi:hypothetical protein